MIFKNPLDPENKDAITFITKWFREAANLNELDKIVILETECANPDCPGTHTTVMITDNEKKTRNFILHKPLVFIRKADVLKLFS